ncbi:sensor histidine kinase [Pararhodobacter zhoushanensis]|uniref:histidine kinase n=1 Tax=Pararhodobacter zhoushanensis TaxID=2479545 RepID=A0ABT3GVB7_9RHOB|nr:ATP-binding protein [Pararhodobacter zhoushanensis]MCW1931491.1 ATP-binding protein [Pararhodobacter zhoushanensis]
MTARLKIRAAVLISLVVVMLASLYVLELRGKVETTETVTSEIADAFLGLERAIGYSGLIHYFKNAVLRPNEPVYLDLGAQAYATAIAEMARVQTLLLQAELTLDASEIRTTIDAYGHALDAIRAAHAAGTAIADVDRLVRIDDTGAQSALISLHREIDGLLHLRQRAAAQLLSIGLTALFLLICSLITAIIYLGWQRERKLLLTYERQRVELAQEKAHAEAIGTLLTRLETANKEQAEFTYAMSHDLKSPSNTIRMLIDELAEMETLTPEGREMLADMRATNQRMCRLVDDVLRYSQIVDTPMTVETVDLTALIKEVKADLASEIAQSRATVSTSALPTLMGNQMQLRMLFQNLISNAVKFRAPDRRPLIEITSERAPDGLQIVIADNGIGIPETFRDRVFGLFQRLNAQSAYDGTGLGLTICQRVMSNHQGRITIGPGIDGGTAFAMTFPETLL